MSKQYKGITCAYCGMPESSTDGDHVLARAFVLERHRANLPKVPACTSCNNAKSRLETNLAAVLPFGARHEHAWEALSKRVPKMLNVNQKLKRQIGDSMKPVWVRERGVLARTATIHIDAKALQEWVVLLARGLSFHHWQMAFGDEFDVEFVAPEKPIILRQLFERRADRKVPLTTIGGGALTYQGVLALDPISAVWRMIVFGGVTIGGNVPPQTTSEFGVFVLRKDLKPVAAE